MIQWALDGTEEGTAISTSRTKKNRFFEGEIDLATPNQDIILLIKVAPQNSIES